MRITAAILGLREQTQAGRAAPREVILESMFVHVLFFLFFIVSSAFGQNGMSVELGVRGGVPLQPVVDLQHDQYFRFAGGGDYIYAPHYMVGPTVTLNFNSQAGIQFDALYKPIRFRTDVILPGPIEGNGKSIFITIHAPWE